MSNLVVFVTAAGYIGIALVIFAETGLLLGFFLPGDSLLFTAGFLASQGVFDIVTLIVVAFVAAVIGDSTGYAIGHGMGPKIFSREDSVFFHKDHLERTRLFYEKHGGKTLILARFLPILRTFAPVLAGVGSMKYSFFLFYNVAGALLWACGLPLLGFFLGAAIPGVDHYLLPIIAGIILISILPTLLHVLGDKQRRVQLRNMIAAKFGRR